MAPSGSSGNGPGSGQWLPAARASRSATSDGNLRRPGPKSRMTVRDRTRSSRLMEIACHGTRKSRQNGPNNRIRPILRPEVHAPRRSTPRIPTPPSDPDWLLSISNAASGRSGNRLIRLYQPDRNPSKVVAPNQRRAKQRRKAIGETEIFARYTSQLPYPPRLFEYADYGRFWWVASHPTAGGHFQPILKTGPDPETIAKAPLSDDNLMEIGGGTPTKNFGFCLLLSIRSKW